jgi:predicted nuclease of predicted toxin-antitoxin system
VIVWIDAQLPPALAPWLRRRFELEAYAVRDLKLRDADDPMIFAAAREAGAVVLTKDADFVALLERHGPPPQIVWVTTGNTSNAVLRGVLERHWPTAAQLLEAGEPLVEIGGSSGAI